MENSIFSDPAVRRAYVWSKVGIFVLAAVLTWPLSTFFGAKAWIGLGVFGLVLGVMTALVLMTVGRRRGEETENVLSEAEEEETSSDPSGDPVVLPIEDSIDLHSFPPRDIPRIVEDYLSAAIEEGFDEVRIIHGRGIGVQRERTRSVLEHHPNVVKYGDASPERGGWGATVVELRVDSHQSGQE